MTNLKQSLLVLPLALAACGVKVNGKSYGLGGSSSSSTGGSSSAGDNGNDGSNEARNGGSSDGSSASASNVESTDLAPRYAAPSTQCYMMTEDGDHPPILSSPADPWLAVSSDQPVDLGHRSLTLWQPDSPDCSAQHDHCLRDCIWFTGDSPHPSAPEPSFLAIYGKGEVSVTLRGAPMYRTVPATKRMLTRGAIVVALRDMAPEPRGTTDEWQLGTLDRVDWKNETMYMVGSTDPYRLSSTRVAVLSWREGGKVEIVGGRKRDELRVRADELFLPRTIVSTSDPWSQVKDGNPIVVADQQPFAEVGTCTPANDHCLRPWAWLVDNDSGHAFVGKFDGKTFQAMSAIDEPKRIDGIVAAYRTVPATAANLKVGVQVFFGGGTEKAAHTLRWNIGKVKRVRDDGKVDVETTSQNLTLPVDLLRVPVLVWWPGEPVEKL
jgi:hypothetical protein